jgi:hypothetical protein
LQRNSQFDSAAAFTRRARDLRGHQNMKEFAPN